jgi:hypothetical protein
MNGNVNGLYGGITDQSLSGIDNGTGYGVANGIYTDVQNKQIVRNGLVLYLDATNRQSYVGSGTVWNDLSSGGNNGTLINGPTFNSLNGGNIVFDGIGNYVRNTTIPTFNVFSIDIWFKPTTIVNSSTSIKCLIQLRYDNAINTSWYIALGAATSLVSNEYITIADVSNDRRTSVTDGGSLLANNWYNLVINYESTLYKIYVNGVINTTVSSPSGDVGLLTNPSRLYLCALDGEGSPTRIFLDASIGSVKLYDRPLNQTEVLQNYIAMKKIYGL